VAMLVSVEEGYEEWRQAAKNEWEKYAIKAC